LLPGNLDLRTVLLKTGRTSRKLLMKDEKTVRKTLEVEEQGLYFVALGSLTTFHLFLHGKTEKDI
jgi:hypothetical protein